MQGQQEPQPHQQPPQKRKFQATRSRPHPPVLPPVKKLQLLSAPSHSAIKEELTSKAGLGLTVQARRRNVAMLTESLKSSRPDIDAIAAAEYLEWYCFSNSSNRAVYMHHLCDQRKVAKTGRGRLLP